jgi:hypothetical protein
MQYYYYFFYYYYYYYYYYYISPYSCFVHYLYGSYVCVHVYIEWRTIPRWKYRFPTVLVAAEKPVVEKIKIFLSLFLFLSRCFSLSICLVPFEKNAPRTGAISLSHPRSVRPRDGLAHACRCNFLYSHISRGCWPPDAALPPGGAAVERVVLSTAVVFNLGVANHRFGDRQK